MTVISFTVRYYPGAKFGLVAGRGDDSGGFLMGSPRRAVTMAAMTACERVQADVRVRLQGDALAYSVPSTGAKATTELPVDADEEFLRDVCDVLVDMLVSLNDAQN